MLNLLITVKKIIAIKNDGKQTPNKLIKAPINLYFLYPTKTEILVAIGPGVTCAIEIIFKKSFSETNLFFTSSSNSIAIIA